MENLVVVGLSELRPFFWTYEQFVSHLWNYFSGANDRSSLWNDTQVYIQMHYYFQNKVAEIFAKLRGFAHHF